MQWMGVGHLLVKYSFLPRYFPCNLSPFSVDQRKGVLGNDTSFFLVEQLVLWTVEYKLYCLEKVVRRLLSNYTRRAFVTLSGFGPQSCWFRALMLAHQTSTQVD